MNERMKIQRYKAVNGKVKSTVIGSLVEREREIWE